MNVQPPWPANKRLENNTRRRLDIITPLALHNVIFSWILIRLNFVRSSFHGMQCNVFNQWSFIKLHETVWYSELKDSFRSNLLTQNNIHLFNFVSRHFSVSLKRRMSSVQTLNPSRPRWLWHLMFINVQSISRKLDMSSSVPCPPSLYEQQWCRDQKKNLLAELFFS